jgi:hypothetical protein
MRKSFGQLSDYATHPGGGAMQRSSTAATSAASGTLLLTVAILLNSAPAGSQSCASPQDIVTFEDAALQQAVIRQLGLTAANVTCGDIAKLRELNARDANIASLKGLEKATELQRLDCSRNRIRDLTPLAELRRLVEIVLERNVITDLGPLVKNPQIGAGTSLNVSLNCLVLSATSDAQKALDTLEKRGVDIGDPHQQKDPALCGGNVESGSLVANQQHSLHPLLLH